MDGQLLPIDWGDVPCVKNKPDVGFVWQLAPLNEEIIF